MRINAKQFALAAKARGLEVCEYYPGNYLISIGTGHILLSTKGGDPTG